MRYFIPPENASTKTGLVDTLEQLNSTDDDTFVSFDDQIPGFLASSLSPGQDSASSVATGNTGVSSPGAIAASAGSGALSFTNHFGLDSTFSGLSGGEQSALETDLVAAEANYSSLFTNPVNIKLDLEAVDDAGSNFIASNEASTYRLVSLSQYFSALQSVDTSTYQENSLAAVEKLNLSASGDILLPGAYATMLGLGSAGQEQTSTSITLGSQTYALPTSVDDTVFVNLAYIQQALDARATNTPNASIVGVIEHEISEEAMGRIAFLPESEDDYWTPLDFYRVTSAGQSDMNPNDGKAIFFSPDPNETGPESALEFNNSSGGGDYADWTTTATSDPGSTDPFGGGYFNGAVGSESSTLSSTDIDIMNVLGWNLASSGGAPPLSIALADDTGVSSSDKLTDNATLTGGAAANAAITFTSQTGANLGSTTADAGGSWTFKPSLADGQPTVTASESYGSGQTITASVTFTLATVAPTVSATESVSGATSATSDTITVTAAAENVAGDSIVGVEIFDGSADLGAAAYANGVWTYVANNLRPGEHTFTAKATDAAGNTGSVALAPVTVSGSQPVARYKLSAISFTGDGVTDILPRGINDSGEIVGYYLDARGDQTNSDDQIVYEHGFYSTISNGARSYDFVGDPVSSTSLPLVQTRITGINDKGEFVGWFAQQGDDIGSNGEPYRLPAAGFIDAEPWPGTVGVLGYQATGDFGTHALGINNEEQIVGYYYDGAGEEHGFLREFTGYGVRGDYITIDPPGSVDTVAEGINDSGLIVGFYQTSDGVLHGFSYNSVNAVWTPIDVNGATNTEVIGVNNSGEVVGYYVDSSGTDHGFVRTASGQYVTIDDPNAGSGGTVVSGINNEGQIVGWYTAPNGLDYGFFGASSPTPTDFNGDGKSDILWRNTSGDTYIWNSNSAGGFTGEDFGGVDTGWQIAGTGDFNGDGKADILWRNVNGDTYLWNSNGAGGFTGQDFGVVDPSWQIAGTGDFNGDNKSDVLWRNVSGETYLWNSNGEGGFTGQDFGIVDPSWQIAGTGDFNGDNKSDVLWRNTNGDVYLWNSNGAGGFTGQDLGDVNTSWQIAGTGDFNGDGKADILWRNANGDTVVWNSNGAGGFTAQDFGVVDESWQIAATGDFNGDGKSDVLWRNTGGDTYLWDSKGAGGFTGIDLGYVPTSWKIQA